MMNEADIWREVASRIAGYFRPNPMPSYIVSLIETNVRKEAAEIAERQKIDDLVGQTKT